MPSKKTPAKHPLMLMQCTTRDETLDAIEQLIDQRKQFTVTTDDDTKGWIISYSTGPNKT